MLRNLKPRCFFEMVIFSITGLVLIFPQPSLAWGSSGHALICQEAAKLVKTPALQAFFSTRGELMAHVCNLPDTYWRNLTPEAADGDAAHFLSPEAAGTTTTSVPFKMRDYLALDQNPKDDTTLKKHEALGSLYWRSQQFYKLSVEAGQMAQSSAFPEKNQEQDENFAFNRGIFGFMTNLALMGHFVADASMPFHTVADYDGWDENHGGIHSFYETVCVSNYDFTLPNEVYRAALRTPFFPKSSSSPGFEITRAVAIQSSAEKNLAILLDNIITSSIAVPNRQRAERAQPDVACPAFRPMIVNELARSAAALAQLWDQAYIDAGKPDITKYRLYKFPMTIDFIYPDYLKAI